MDQDKLRDILYRHAVAARDIGQGLADKIVRQLNALDADLVEQITKRYSIIEADGFDKGPATTKRLEEMLAAIREVNSKVYAKVAACITDELEQIAGHEAEFAAKSAGAAIDLTTTIPSTSFLKTLVTTTPLPFADDGHTLLMPWLSTQEAGRLRRLEGALRLGIGEGQTTADLVKRIRGTKANNYTDGILQTSRKDATTIALTANAAIQNAAREETYKRMKTIRFLEWSAILDSRTSQICQSRSGTIYEIDAPHPSPPAHPRCRSILIPRRDDVGTKHRPYGDWLKDQPEHVQDEVLGKARADIFRQNPDFDFAKFFKENGSYRTLAELREFDAKLVADAPIEPIAEIIDTKRLDAEARDYVLAKGKKTGNEHLVAYDDRTGRILDRKEGDRSSVSFSDKLVAAIKNPANSIVLHHNHPRSSSLSLQDLIVGTRSPGVKSIWAHGHNGSSYYAERGKFPLKETTVKAISDRLTNALRKLIEIAIVTPEEASLLLNHLTWLHLHEVGQVIYRAELDGTSKAAFERNSALFTTLLESLK